MSEERKGFVTKQEIEDAAEMLGVGYEHRVTDESNDRKYFIITPRIVKAFCRNPYDLALWDTVKDVAGEGGECFLNTSQLAALSGMSAGKASDSRKYWIEIGFLKGEIRQDPGYPQPVWHLTVPDLWQKNIEWCEKHPKIQDRIEFMSSLHLVKPSPGEERLTPREEGVSPRETKKNLKKSKKEKKVAASPRAGQILELAIFRETTNRYPDTILFEDVEQAIKRVSARLGHQATKDDLLPFYKAWRSRGYNAVSIHWLEWAETGAIPVNGNWKPRNTSPAIQPLPDAERQRLIKQAEKDFA